jgi:hypothetical protein
MLGALDAGLRKVVNVRGSDRFGAADLKAIHEILPFACAAADDYVIFTL